MSDVSSHFFALAVFKSELTGLAGAPPALVEGREHVACFDGFEPQDYLQVEDRGHVHFVVPDGSLLSREVPQTELALGVQVDVLGTERRLLAVPPPAIGGLTARRGRRGLSPL